MYRKPAWVDGIANIIIGENGPIEGDAVIEGWRGKNVYVDNNINREFIINGTEISTIFMKPGIEVWEILAEGSNIDRIVMREIKYDRFVAGNSNIRMIEAQDSKGEVVSIVNCNINPEKRLNLTYTINLGRTNLGYLRIDNSIVHKRDISLYGANIKDLDISNSFVDGRIYAEELNSDSIKIENSTLRSFDGDGINCKKMEINDSRFTDTLIGGLSLDYTKIDEVKIRNCEFIARASFANSKFDELTIENTPGRLGRVGKCTKKKIDLSEAEINKLKIYEGEFKEINFSNARIDEFEGEVPKNYWRKFSYNIKGAELPENLEKQLSKYGKPVKRFTF